MIKIKMSAIHSIKSTYCRSQSVFKIFQRIKMSFFLENGAKYKKLWHPNIFFVFLPFFCFSSISYFMIVPSHKKILGAFNKHKYVYIKKNESFVSLRHLIQRKKKKSPCVELIVDVIIMINPLLKLQWLKYINWQTKVLYWLFFFFTWISKWIHTERKTRT